MARIDILEDANGDDLIADGDFAIGESDALHVRDLLIDSPGDWRQYPEIGLLINRYKNSSATNKLKFDSELRAMLQNDGYKVNKVDLSMKDWWKNFMVDCEVA